jgi:hypothetical protein
VPQDLGSGVHIDAGRDGDAGDNVAGATHGQPPAAVIEEQGWVGIGAGPAGAVRKPVVDVSLQVRMNGDVADPVAVALDA